MSASGLGCVKTFATDPAGFACHLVSALAGKRPDCDRTRMADISAPPRFMRETQCCPKRALERSRLFCLHGLHGALAGLGFAQRRGVTDMHLPSNPSGAHYR